MEKQASEMMGEAVVAAVQLEAQALVKGAMGGGILGTLAGNALAGVEVKDTSLPGDHKGIIFMAVGKNKVGFFSVKQGIFKNSLNEKLAEFSCSDVKVVEIEKGMMPTAHIVFQDGTHYALKCAKMNVKNLNKVKELLAAS